LKPGAPELSLKELKDFLKSRLGKHDMISEMEIRAALPRDSGRQAVQKGVVQ